MEQRYRAYEQTHDANMEQAGRDLEAFRRNAPDDKNLPAPAATDAL